MNIRVARCESKSTMFCQRRALRRVATTRAERAGTTIAQKSVDVYDMRDGKVTEAWTFSDQQTVAAFLE
jgi:ketosteroid isomerase-like protein